MRADHDDAGMTPDRFLDWTRGQDVRFELARGHVVMMAGAGRRHDLIVTNLIASVRPQTRGGRCQTFSGDTYIATGPTTLRMPDMGIDCGHPSDDALTAEAPALVVEVLSPSTRSFDMSVKLAEYKTLPSLRYILFIDTEYPSVQLFWRDAGAAWRDAVIEGLDAIVELPSVAVTIPLSAIYDELSFRAKPRLVDGGDDREET